MIIGLAGNLGRGKTLGMTMLGHYFKIQTGLTHVVSNYETDITTNYVTNSNELEEMSKNVEGIYLLDEIWAWMSSRDAMKNDEMIDLVLNSRKRGCLIVYTVQNMKMADNILTDITDYYGVCSHYEGHEVGLEHDIAEIQLFNGDGEPVKTFRYNAETYYGTYDTSEEISSQTDAEKYKDKIEMVIEKKNNNEFETKKEAWAFLELHTDLSHSKKDAIIDEAFRKAEKPNKEQNGGEIQNELQEYS